MKILVFYLWQSGSWWGNGNKNGF